jgi:TRAP transporter TAXI family solute receptor
VSASRFAMIFATVTVLAAGAVAPAHAQDRAGWPAEVRIGTASAGGTYAVYGEGLARLLQETLQIQAQARNTGGPAQNLVLVHKGELDLGMTTMGPAREAWEGQSPLMSGTEMRNLRALFPMYQTPFLILALADSGIARIEDLAGRRVGVGPAGGTCAAYWPGFFEALGIEEVRPVHGSGEELATDLRFGAIHAFAFCGGVPIPVFVELEQRQPVTIFGLTPEQQAKLAADFPVSAVEIPPGSYASLTAPVTTVAMWNFVVTNDALPETLVYEIMRTVLDDNARMTAIHPAAKETRTENWVHDGFLPFHAGAVRYYREKGIDLRPELVPPEAGS